LPVITKSGVNNRAMSIPWLRLNGQTATWHRMVTRRTALISGLAVAALPLAWRTAAAQLSSQDTADLGRIQAYLNNTRSLRARFVQTASDGGVSQGLALLQRPGKLRFQYDPPTPFLLVADHGILVFHDAQLDQTSNIPLSQTPLGILLGDQISLSGNVTVTKFVRLPGQLQVSLVRTSSPGEGTLTLIFADNPLQLRQWSVVDQQGKTTRVAFTSLEPGATIDPRLFEFSGMPRGAGGGG
jgi:outer membrane lipoprotein-sorting protein